ncbi:MAG TPA: thioesterase domain-containing protein, partial [Polyangiaceae bacterium]|nr:thioesterase domain-containing protein [Polyangiaceae bacterium]
AALAVQGEAADARLVAYVVERRPLGDDALREFLRQVLPEYMLPAHFRALSSLPTNANGKLDRKALPKVDSRPSAGVLPRDELERTLASAFAGILRTESVGIFDNFFELGGHSLSAAELAFRLSDELGVELPVKALFESPTVAGLAATLRRGDSSEFGRGIVVARRGSGTPWFCFPALAGTSAPYLAAITPVGAPVFLLEAPGVDSGSPLTSVESLAQHFRTLVESAAPSGPVRLLGWSFGAVTAFETAAALASHGREVAELVLVDPALPGARAPRDLAETFVMDAAESLDEVGALEPLSALSRERIEPADLFARARDIGVFSKRVGLQEIERRFSVYVASWRALEEYRCAQRYAGRTVILAATQGNGRSAERWLEVLPRAELSSIEANHYTILGQLRGLLR